MDAHQQIPASLPPASPLPSPPVAQSSRKSRSSEPTILSGKLLLVVIIGVVAVQLGAVLLAPITAADSTIGPAWLHFQAELRGQIAIMVYCFLFLLALAGIFFLTITVHESGHALIGLLVGCWLYQGKIGPLMITRVPRGFHLHRSRINKVWGSIIAFPPWQHIRLRMFAVWGGGPLASLLWLVVSAWLFTLVGASACSGRPLVNCFREGLFAWASTDSLNVAPWLTSLLAWTLLLAFYICCFNLIPLTVRKGVSNDALKMLRGLRGGPKLEHDLLLACVTGLLYRGVRPREWPADLAVRLQAMLQQFPADYLLLVYSYALALDQHQIQEAGTLLDRFTVAVKEKPAVGAIWALEFAFFEARHRGNLTAAHAWLAQATLKKNPTDDLLRLRAEAAISLREGCLTEAQSSINGALAALTQLKKTSLGKLQMEEEDLQEMLAEAQGRLASDEDQAHIR